MIDRSAFLYMDPQPPEGSFAQCGTCALFDTNQCAILTEPAVDAGDSCGLYVHGESMGLEPCKLVTPEEAGFVTETQVRCENCKYFLEPATCGLYAKLNNAGLTFNLNSRVSADGCCNAWEAATDQSEFDKGYEL